jgi:hypothetical protein
MMSGEIALMSGCGMDGARDGDERFAMVPPLRHQGVYFSPRDVCVA